MKYILTMISIIVLILINSILIRIRYLDWTNMRVYISLNIFIIDQEGTDSQGY